MIHVRVGVAFSTEEEDKADEIAEDVCQAISARLEYHGYDPSEDFYIAVGAVETDDDDECTCGECY